MKNPAPAIVGNLDVFVIQNEEEFEGKIEKRLEILIHGDPDGLRSLATLLTEIADTNQSDLADLPIRARQHVHLRPGRELSNSSERVIIGRLDAKGTGAFYDRFIPAKR